MIRVVQQIPRLHITMPKDAIGRDGKQRREGDRIVMAPCHLEEFRRATRVRRG